LKSQSEQFGLAKKKAKDIINELIKNLQNWPNHFIDCGFNAEDVEQFKPSFIRAGIKKFI
jgi:hypothetical protein